MKPMSRRKFLRLLKERGWVLDRTDGDHDIYCKARESVAVPRHTQVSPGVLRDWDRKNSQADEEGPS